MEKISENQKKTKIKLDEILSNIPNIPNFDVPDGKDENDNVELIAISCDPMYANKVFAEQEGYKFQVLSDFWPHGGVAKAYGTFEESRGCAKRGTFIIGKDGNLKWQIVNGLGDARNIVEYKAALSAL